MTYAQPKLTRPVSSADHIQGPESAPVTLVEYGDFECPHCGAAFPVVEKLRHQFGNKLRFVFRNFPLSEVHPHAEIAAEASEAAAAQDRFWEMHHAIFTHQRTLDAAHLLRFAGNMGLDTAMFSHALAAHTFQAKVREDFMSGVRSGVNGTPTFFINGLRYDGPAEFDSMADALNEAATPSA